MIRRRSRLAGSLFGGSRPTGPVASLRAIMTAFGALLDMHVGAIDRRRLAVSAHCGSVCVWFALRAGRIISLVASQLPSETTAF